MLSNMFIQPRRQRMPSSKTVHQCLGTPLKVNSSELAFLNTVGAQSESRSAFGTKAALEQQRNLQRQAKCCDYRLLPGSIPTKNPYGRPDSSCDCPNSAIIASRECLETAASGLVLMPCLPKKIQGRRLLQQLPLMLPSWMLLRNNLAVHLCCSECVCHLL